MNAHRKHLLRLAGPVYLALLASVAAGIINTVWVARLGGPAVAAVAVATNTENVLLGIALVFGSGTTVLVAHARGARDPGAVRAAVRGGWALWALVTPPVVAGGLLGREPLARLVLGGADSAALPLAVAYFTLSMPGMAVFFAQQLVDGILKGTGDTQDTDAARLAVQRPDPGPRPALHPSPRRPGRRRLHGAVPVRGARGGTRRGAAQRAVARGPARRSRASPRPSVCAGRWRPVCPMSADFTVRQTGALVLVAIVARLGVTAVAAYAIAYKVMYVATMAFYALRQAASIHTAHTLGAGEDERRAIGRQAVLVSGALGLTAAVVLAVAAPWLMAAFGAGPGVAREGVLFLRCVGPYLLLMACLIALGGVFEGGGGASVLLRVTVLGTAVQPALAYSLTGLGLPGVCLALALATAVQCVPAGVLFRRATAQEETGVSPARAG